MAIAIDSVEAAEEEVAGIATIVIDTMDDKRTSIVAYAPRHLPVVITSDRTRMVEIEVAGIHPRIIQGLVARVLLRRSAAAAVVATDAGVTVHIVVLLPQRLTLIFLAAMPVTFPTSSCYCCKRLTENLWTGCSEHLSSAA
jgi:hypothetical protein